MLGGTLHRIMIKNFKMRSGTLLAIIMLMDGCKNYIVLNEADRSQGNAVLNYLCDRNLVTGWFRFQGDAGVQIPDKCVLMWRCGTRYPGWLNGAHPSVAEGVVTRRVCYTASRNCCVWQNNIKVKNCSGFYVYELQKPPRCSLRYCGNAGAVHGCQNYTVLSEADRAQGNAVKNNLCDRDLVTGWYRFQGDAGDQMPDKCVPSERCGTVYPGWLSGAHPSVAEGVVTLKVCYGYYTCCLFSNNIKVKNCSGFYVYESQRPRLCNLRYCGNAGAATRLPSISRSPPTKKAAERITTTLASASSTRLLSFSPTLSTKSAAEGTTTTPAQASSTRLSSLLISPVTMATVAAGTSPTALPRLSSLLTTLTAAPIPTAAR
ncbi:uncharacterized protein LOC144638984, partial [Oculina patagonica]